MSTTKEIRLDQGLRELQDKLLKAVDDLRALRLTTTSRVSGLAHADASALREALERAADRFIALRGLAASPETWESLVEEGIGDIGLVLMVFNITEVTTGSVNI